MSNFASIILRIMIGGYLIHLGVGLMSGTARSDYNFVFICIAVGFILFGFAAIVLGIKDLILMIIHRGKGPAQDARPEPERRERSMAQRAAMAGGSGSGGNESEIKHGFTEEGDGRTDLQEQN